MRRVAHTTLEALDHEQVPFAKVVETLLQSRELIVEHEELVADALRGFVTGSADFADYLIERAGHLAGCDHTFTFDKRATSFAGMRLLK